MNTNTIDSNLLKQDAYQYGMYEEYIDNIYKNLFFSDKKSLSIKYFKLNLDVSRIYDDETAVSNDHIKNKNKYDIYNFCPTIDSNSLSYDTSNHFENGGFKTKTSGSISIIVLEEPLPGDMFLYYNNDTEVFKVTSVNFIRNAHNKLKIYQLNYETGNIKSDHKEDMIINKEYFYLTEFEFFFESIEYNNYVNIVQNKENTLKSLDKYYNSLTCLYECSLNNDQQNKKLNNILKFLNKTIPSFQTRYQDFKIEYNQYKTVDNFIEDECYIPKEEPILLPPDADDPTDLKYKYNAHLNEDEIKPNKLVKDLYNWYYQLINHKRQRKDEISWNQQ